MKYRLSMVSFTTLFVILALVSLTTEVTAENCEKQPVVPLLAAVQGEGKLCIANDGLRARMQVQELTLGDAYTVWWTYIDDPSLCAIPGECGNEAFVGDNPLGVFGRMDSVVASGKMNESFSGTVRGFQPSSGSQVWYFLFGHGPADMGDKRHLARQLLTPEDPTAGIPHLGNNVDGPLGFPVGVVIFNIP